MRAGESTLSPDLLTPEALEKIRALNEIAEARGQSLAQMAVAWVLRDPRVTSALVGASSVEQLEANVAALENLEFSPERAGEIDRYATDSGINLWAGFEQRVESLAGHLLSAVDRQRAGASCSASPARPRPGKTKLAEALAEPDRRTRGATASRWSRRWTDSISRTRYSTR